MIFLIIPAIIVLIIGATIIAINLDNIKTKLYGKNLAILGARKSGKSTIHKFIEEGVIYAEYEYKPSHEVNKTKGGKLKIADLDLYIKAGRDVTGDPERAQWNEVIEISDFTMYVFRIDWIIEGKKDYQKRIMDDLKSISKTVIERQRNNPKFRACLLGTHFDLVNTPNDDKLQIETKFKNHEFFKQGALLMGGSAKTSIVLGSLSNPDDASYLMARALKAFAE